MFSTISWGQYLLFVGAATAAYYLVLGFTCYRSDLSRVFRRKAPEPRRSLSIPVVNGVMGSVLFDDDDNAPDSSSPSADQDVPNPDQEDYDPYFNNEEFGDEAEQARQWDQMEHLVQQLSDIITKSPKDITPETLIIELRRPIHESDPDVFVKFKDSVANHIRDLAAQQLKLTLTDADIRQLWK